MAISGKKAAKKLSQTISHGSGEDFELFCQPCDHDDIRLPAFGYCVNCAEHLCESCFTTHRRPKPLRHHQLLGKNHMPQTQTTSTASTQAEQSDDLTMPCTKHKKEMIKYYCHDHKALLCNVCVTLQHTRTPCSINYIPDISGQLVDSIEYRNILKQVQSQNEECQKIVADLRNQSAKSNSSLIDVLAEVQKYRQEINQRLDQLEREAIDRAKKLNQENSRRLQTAAASCDHVIKALKSSSDSIKQLNTSKKADKLFVELKQAVHLLADHEKIMSQLVSFQEVKKYTFKPNKALSECLEMEKSLGILTEKTLQVQNLPQAIASKPNTASLQSNICVKTKEDSFNCWITGMAMSSPGQLFLADNYNFAVKVLDINSQTTPQRLKLDSRPWDITMVSRDLLAVTMPDTGTIQFVSFSSGKLSKKNTLKLDGYCHGISCYQGKLAVSFCDPAILQIIDLKGNILATVTTKSWGRKLFSDPQYVTTNSSCIYVSDSGKKAVIRLNWRGELTGSYGDMGAPCGLATLEDGSIFVCDRDKCNIQHISGDCKTSTTILKDLNDLQAVCTSEENSTLYVSTHIWDEDSDNYIYMYKM